VSRGTKCHITRPCDGGHLLNPRGPPLESHISHVTVFLVNQYCEIQLEIILNISNKDTTYTGSEKTDGLQQVRFHNGSMLQHYSELPEAIGVPVGCNDTLN